MNRHFHQRLYKLAAGCMIAVQISCPISVFANTSSIITNAYPIVTETESGTKAFNNISTYLIDDRTYIKLRDIAEAFHFKIQWDNTSKAVLLSLEEHNPSTTKNEITKDTAPVQGTLTEQAVIVDGVEQVLPCYLINGYTYFSIRDIAALTNREVTWDSDSHTILVNEKSVNASTLDETSKPETTDTVLYENGKDIICNDNNLIYVPESKQYDSIEKFIKENIDPEFEISDFVITEYTSSNTPSIHYLDIDYYLGDYKTNYGYQITIVQESVKTIKCKGDRKKIESLNIDKNKIPVISNEELWEKTLEENSYENCEIIDYDIVRYYNEKTAAFQADVVVDFIDPSGYRGSNRHTFVL